MLIQRLGALDAHPRILKLTFPLAEELGALDKIALGE